MKMTSNKLNVRVNINDSQLLKSKIVKLTLENNLSTIRENLKDDKTIKMNDRLLFSKKFADNKLAEISRENENDFTLNDIVEKSNDTEAPYTLCLIETSSYWKFLNDKHKLDFGCTMTSNGIERANHRAFITEACQLNEVDIKKEIQVGSNSLEDRMMKTNLFFEPNMNVEYFASIGKKDKSNIKDITHKYLYQKASFKIQDLTLKATDSFIKEVNDALNFEDPEKFVQITEEFGQFIPTEVILGKSFQTDNRTEDEVDSLNDHRNWDIIELRKPISIFELVEDGLREKLYSFFGKRILHSEITTEPFGNKHIKIIELPQRISEIIAKEHTDCSIFATAIGIKDYYHCQILTSLSPNEEPKLIIHSFKEKSKDKDNQLVIGWMVIGNDTNFESVRSFHNTQFKVSKLDVNSFDDEINSKILEPPTEKPYYIGIPYTKDKSDPVIGHYFSNDRKKLYTFAYSPKDKQCVKLPEFRLHLLEMTDSCDILEKTINHSINLNHINKFKKFKNIPKFISLYSTKDERDKRKSILLKQRPTQVKVKFFNNQPSLVFGKLTDDLKCSFFVPFERYFISLYSLSIFLININSTFFSLFSNKTSLKFS
jgi:hypothetical protein